MEFVIAAVVLGLPAMFYTLLFMELRSFSAKSSRKNEGKVARRAA